MGSIHNRKYLKERRRELRNQLTSAEAVLWKALQQSKLYGRKFRRQHSVGNFIVDFYCPSEKLAIELDGENHFLEEGVLKDFSKTNYLNNLGIKVLRFENRIVFERLDDVLLAIADNFKTPPRQA